MPDMYRVQVEDDRNDENEVWEHLVPITIPLDDVARAVAILYPNATEINFKVVEEAEDT